MDSNWNGNKNRNMNRADREKTISSIQSAKIVSFDWLS